MDEILEKYQVRKSNKEKTEFIAYLKKRLAGSGYGEDDIVIEEKGKGLFKSRNIVVGNPKQAEVLFTAHYDTCAVLPFPNLMAPSNPLLFLGYQVILAIMLMCLALIVAIPVWAISRNALLGYYVFLLMFVLLLVQLMFGFKNKHTANDNTSGVVTITKLLEALPQEHRHKICVVYFDNEEKGLFGSSFFKKKHKEEVKDTLLINLDCVGDGENIVSFVKWKAQKDEKYSLFTETLSKCAEKAPVKYLKKKMKPMMFPSDQNHFDNAVAVCALRKSPIGMYAARIHTPWDTRCREENVTFLVDAIKEFVEKIKQ